MTAGFEKEEETERRAILTVARLNSALCYLKLEDFTEAKAQCESALKQEPNNEKGLFRRGQVICVLFNILSICLGRKLHSFMFQSNYLLLL